MLTWLWAWPLDKSRQAHPAGDSFMTTAAPCLNMLLLYLLAMGTLHAPLLVHFAEALVLPSL